MSLGIVSLDRELDKKFARQTTWADGQDVGQAPTVTGKGSCLERASIDQLVGCFA